MSIEVLAIVIGIFLSIGMILFLFEAMTGGDENHE